VGFRARAARELAAAGEKVAIQPARESRDELTDREAQIASMASRGLSNRQIGEQLFISTKTASVHVSSILAKLGAASRGEAAATAYRLGLFDLADSPADLR
jgi:DNA-binding NarL/FixJ family response regulator